MYAHERWFFLPMFHNFLEGYYFFKTIFGSSRKNDGRNLNKNKKLAAVTSKTAGFSASDHSFKN